MEMVSKIKSIYSRMGDDLSKECFKARLLYAMTGDYLEICRLASYTFPGITIREKLKKYKEAKIFIWGAGTWGGIIRRSFPDIDWQGFIDSNPKEKEKKGLPVYSPDEFIKSSKNSFVLVSSTDWHTQILEQLSELGFSMEQVIDAGEMIIDLFNCQYFDLPYLQHAENEIFVDAGCYDGSSVRNFIKWSQGKYKAIFSSEPDIQCYKKCQETLRDVDNFYLEKRGLWSSQTRLSFSAKGDSTSKIVTGGEESIQTVCLDDMVGDKKVTFIKMDIEGAEKEALIGASKTIGNYKPKLAICIYHKPQDVWEIPGLILELNPKYRFYVRHYSLYDPETILYAV